MTRGRNNVSPLGQKTGVEDSDKGFVKTKLRQHAYILAEEEVAESGKRTLHKEALVFSSR